MPTRAGLFLRVSTDEQTTANQIAPLRELARARGFEVTKTYEEIASTKHAKTRPVLAAMRADAAAKCFDVLVVWALDRLGRSMHGNLGLVVELDRAGVGLVSVQEPWLDTTSPVRSLLIAIFSWVAEQERERAIARINAGMKRAREEGKHLGRRGIDYDQAMALELLKDGRSLREVSGILGVPLTTLHRLAKRAA